MKRSILVVVAMLLCCGCKTPEPGAAPVDPFFGRTRIEPPRTGSIAAPRASDPYYSGTRQTSAPGASATASSAAVGPSAGSGGWQPAATPQTSNSGLRLQNISPPVAARSVPAAQNGQGDLVTVPVAARRSTPDTPVASESGSTAYDAARQIASGLYQKSKSVYQDGKAAVLANRERIVRTIEPRPQQGSSSTGTIAPNAGGAGAATEPRKLSIPASKPVNITDLPEVRRSSAAAEPGGKIHRDGIQLTSATEAIPTVQSDPSAAYGFDPQYRWLKGRLEYSQADRAWKLRYIPLDGATDQYGGSVLLSESKLLSGYERGDLVEVHGRMVPPEKGTATFAGAYEIREIRRLGP
ncbi:MAG: hypothetical protein GXY83_00240 [Rhodopirellula sp.]|nr:hypothetical protein [Rhodopirellula sp.]